MSKQHKEDEPTIDELFDQATANVDWVDIDQLIDRLDSVPEFWGKALKTTNMQRSWQKQFARRYIKSRKDEDGNPVFASIVRQDANGVKTRAYKPERLFDIEDYRQTTGYNVKMMHHFMQMAAYYSNRCDEKHGKIIPLPFKQEDFCFD
jgi:hypothetical protein